MILYNTLMGWTAGVILLVLGGMAASLARPAKFDVFVMPRMVALVLVVTGLPLTFLSALMAVTWPLNVNPPINVAFAEPCLVLGVFALIGGIAGLMDPTFSKDRLRPMELVIGAVGLPLLAISAAVFRFNLVGDAPSAEPITGQFKGWENTTFGLVYLLAALGCFLTAARQYVLAAWSFRAVGAFFLLFASLNYYTHIGLLINLGTGTGYRW